MSSVAKNSSYYAVANMLPQAIGFLFLPIYSRYMSPSDFGIVSAMETLTYIFSILVCCSLDRAAQRFYFDDPCLENQKIMLSTLFISTIAFSAIFVILALLAESIIQPIFGGIPFYPYFLFCILNVALNSFSLITIMYFQVSEQPRKYMVLKVSRFVLQIALTLVFVVWMVEGALGQLKAEMISLFLFLPLYMGIALRNFGCHFDFTILKRAFSYSWPFIPTLLVAWILNLSDRVFLERYVGLDELGIYSMGYKISMAFFVITSAFSMAYTPIFYKLANATEQSRAKQRIFKYGLVAVIAFTVLMFLISLFAKEICDITLGPEYRRSYGIIRIVIIGHLLSAIMAVTSVLYILQAKKTRLNLIIALYAAAANIMLNFLLIPILGMHGAAIATVLSMIVLSVIQYQKSKDAYFVGLPWSKVSILLGVLVFVVVIYHFYIEQSVLITIISKTFILALAISLIVIKRAWVSSYLSEFEGVLS